jgi:hypothetical protein
MVVVWLVAFWLVKKWAVFCTITLLLTSFEGWLLSQYLDSDVDAGWPNPTSPSFLVVIINILFRATLMIVLFCNSALSNLFLTEEKSSSSDDGLSTSSDSLTERTTVKSEPDNYNPPKTFKEFWRHLKRLTPFIWPHGEGAWRLRLLILGCMLMLVLGRIVNVLVPFQYKLLVDALSVDLPTQGGLKAMTVQDWIAVFEKFEMRKIPFWDIIVFVVLRALQGSAGLLGTIQNYLWIPVGQVCTILGSVHSGIPCIYSSYISLQLEWFRFECLNIFTSRCILLDSYPYY